MVTKYSGRTGTVGGRTKLVLTYSPTSVKNSTSSVKVTAKLYWDSKYRTQDAHNTVKMSGSLGSWSGGSNFNGTSKLLHTMTKTISTSYTGTKRITVKGSISGVEASPGSHSVSASITIPKRPVAKPKKPTNVKMALLSDNRTKTTWSHSATTAQPVTSFTVQYRRKDGATYTGWMHSATVKGKSYTSNPGANNHEYQRRVRANNSAGSSGWVNTNYVQMKPSAPTNLKARVKSSGSDIELTWGFDKVVTTTAFKLQLQRRVNNGSWTTVSASFGSFYPSIETTSYVDTKPGNGSNQYRLKIVNNGEGADSAWTTSNTVSTIVPPKAPTHLSPDGGVVDFTESVTFTWQHHDDGDGADQSHYDLRYREAGDSEWTYVEDGGASSEKSEHLFEGGELENGVDYEWQVKTQGNTKEGFGPWSKTAFITGWTAPVVSVRDGAPPNPLTALPVPLAWTYSQDEGQGQIEWQTRLYALGSGDMFDSILDEKSAESSSTSTEFPTALTDGERYGVMVRARSSRGQWSEWSETTFDVELLVPAELRAEVDYNEDTGQMNLHIVSDEPEKGETAEVVQIDVERRINGGEWTPIMVGIPFDAETTLVDNIPSIWGVNEYRVTATTEAPSKGVFGPWRRTVNNDKGNTEMWTFLNYGETFDYMLRMQGDLSLGGSYDRSKETQKLLGRKKPISLLGEQLSREHSVSGTIHFADPCDVDAIPDDPMQIVGSQFFDDSKAWNFAGVQAGPDSRVTADAHYRAKKYGYLIGVPDDNDDNLVSPSPRSGVLGTEVPGREVEEVTARNLFTDSKMSESREYMGMSGQVSGEAVSDGFQITVNSDPGNVSMSMFYMTSSGYLTVEPGQVYSLAYPVRNDGAVPVPIRIHLSTRDGSKKTLKEDSAVSTIKPGETKVLTVEGLEVPDDGAYLSINTYYSPSVEKPAVGSVFTVLDGVTIVQDDVAADPFNGDGPVKYDELARTNLATDPRYGDMSEWKNTKSTSQKVSRGSLFPTFGDWIGDDVMEVTANASSGSYYVEHGKGFPITDQLDIALSVPMQGTGRVWLYFNTAGEGLVSPQLQTSTTTFEDGGLLTVSGSVPEGAAYAIPYLGGMAKSSDSVHYGPLMVAQAETAGDALSDVQTYFDGNSQDTGEKRYVYLGEPGESASAEYRVTDVLRRNLALDPIGPSVGGQGGLRRANGGDVTVEEVDGRNVIAVRRNTNTSESVYIDQQTNFTPPVGTVIHASCWVKVTEDSNVPLRMSCSTYNGAARTVPRSEEVTQQVSDGWVKHEFSSEVTAMPEGAYIRILFWPNTGANVFTEGEGYWIKDFLIEYETEGEFFAFDTPDTYDRLYRKAPDGTSIELVTDSQSLYRWVDGAATSESEKYLPAAPEHFDEYTEMVRVEPEQTYEIEAYVRAPELKNLRRRNLTSQGTFASDRQLWGSKAISTGSGAKWSGDSQFDMGAVRITNSQRGLTTVGALSEKATASSLGVTQLAGSDFTIGIDSYAEEGPDSAQKIIVSFYDSGDAKIEEEDKEFTASEDISRYVIHFAAPPRTNYLRIMVSNSAPNTAIFVSNVTVEEGTTDGTWLEGDAPREWTGAENIDSADLRVESFDRDGESLSVDTVGTLESDEFSSRWRTISGEYSAPAEARTARVWVEWSVNGEHPDRQSDWYFGGMSVRESYSVPERWPGPDANPDEWREAQYESTTVCLRTPSGHRVFGAMSGLDMSAVENNLNSAEISFDVTETDYTENPLVIDESDIWEIFSSGESTTSNAFGRGEVTVPPLVLDPYSESDR